MADDKGIPASEPLPPPDKMSQAASHEVVDKDGKPHTLASLCSTTPRTLVILVRHVFCGSCHAYLQQVASNIAAKELDAAEVSIVVIGCGDPGLIEQYREYSSWPFPVYMDPDEVLYKAFDTNRGSDMGASSTYAHDSFLTAFVKGVSKVLGQVPNGLAFKGGAPGTNGGEFLYEASPSGGTPDMVWCYRMKNSTDHTDVASLRKLLRL